jgi:hypothetical protein
LTGDDRRIVGQLGRELGVEQVGEARAGAVVDEPADDADAQVAQLAQPLVMPREVELGRVAGDHPFPHDRIAHRANAELGDRIEIRQAEGVTGLDQLVAVIVTDPHDRAFHPAPKLERGGHRFSICHCRAPGSDGQAELPAGTTNR